MVPFLQSAHRWFDVEKGIGAMKAHFSPDDKGTADPPAFGF